MEGTDQVTNAYIWKRCLVRVDEGIFKYQEKDGTEKFAVRLKHRGEDYRKFGFPNITKARQWRQSRVGAIADGRLFPERKVGKGLTREILFRDYSTIWLNSCRTKNLKRSTIRRYQGILRKHLLPALGHLPLTCIDRTQAREMIATPHARSLEPKTLHNILRTLSVIFSQANEDGIVAHNPAAKPSKLVRLRKVGEHVEVFDYEEEVLILETAKAFCPQYSPFILTLFRTGLREGEAVALMPEDLDLRSRYVVIERNFTAGQLEDSPKSGKRREVDLSLDLVEVLKEHLALQEAEAALTGGPRPKWLFSSSQGGIIRSNNFRDRLWNPLLKKAGLRYRVIHATRHTFATRLIMEGAPLTYVQRQLGHSSIRTTVDLYFHWIKRAERSRTLDVDRLMKAQSMNSCPDFKGGTSGGTRRVGTSDAVEN